MPRQNRVTPAGEIIATPARGLPMGNRGCLHNDRGQILRPYRGNRWIFCRLEFKGRRRALMTPGHYTELFFLDEATVLSRLRTRSSLTWCWRISCCPGSPKNTAGPQPGAIFSRRAS